MNVEEIKRKWRGCFIPVLTIFDSDLNLDLNGLRKNLKYLLDKGAKTGNTVFLACGAGGDFPTLSLDERKIVAETIVTEVNGKAPVLIGAQDTSTAVSVEIAKHAEKIGADGVQMSPPYYYAPSDDDVFEHFKAVSEAANVGIMAYNTWWLGFNMSFDLIHRLLELENVVSLKWSSESAHAYVKGYRLFADKAAMVDNQVLHAQCHLLGAVGFITHVCSFWPENEWRVWELLEKHDYVTAQKVIDRFHFDFHEFRGKVAALTGGEGVAIKAAMELVGLASGPSRPPTRTNAITDELKDELKEMMKPVLEA